MGFLAYISMPIMPMIARTCCERDRYFQTSFLENLLDPVRRYAADPREHAERLVAAELLEHGVVLRAVADGLAYLGEKCQFDSEIRAGRATTGANSGCSDFLCEKERERGSDLSPLVLHAVPRDEGVSIGRPTLAREHLERGRLARAVHA